METSHSRAPGLGPVGWRTALLVGFKLRSCLPDAETRGWLLSQHSSAASPLPQRRGRRASGEVSTPRRGRPAAIRARGRWPWVALYGNETVRLLRGLRTHRRIVVGSAIPPSQRGRPSGIAAPTGTAFITKHISASSHLIIIGVTGACYKNTRYLTWTPTDLTDMHPI